MVIIVNQYHIHHSRQYRVLTIIIVKSYSVLYLRLASNNFKSVVFHNTYQPHYALLKVRFQRLGSQYILFQKEYRPLLIENLIKHIVKLAVYLPCNILWPCHRKSFFGGKQLFYHSMRHISFGNPHFRQLTYAVISNP